MGWGAPPGDRDPWMHQPETLWCWWGPTGTGHSRTRTRAGTGDSVRGVCRAPCRLGWALDPSVTGSGDVSPVQGQLGWAGGISHQHVAISTGTPVTLWGPQVTQRLTISEERLGQLSEEGFQEAADDVQVLPPLRGTEEAAQRNHPGHPLEMVPKPGGSQATDTERDTSQHHCGCGNGRAAVPTLHRARKALCWCHHKGTQMCP